MTEPYNPKPWSRRQTGTAVAYYDANGALVSFALNHDYIWAVVERDQKQEATVKAVLDMPETVDE